MNIYNKELNTMIALLGTVFTWLFGAWDLPLMILVSAMVIDYATGVTRGYVNKQLSSEYGFRGLAKKVTIFYVLIVGVLIDRLTGNIGVFRGLVCFWYSCNEFTSILENTGAIGIPIPPQLLDTLAQLKQGNKKYKEVE